MFLIPLFVIPRVSARAAAAGSRPPAQVDNALYLDAAFVLRGVIYLLIWLVLAVLVTRAAANANELARLAPPALILLALTTTFADIDAIMSLEPTFASSIFGLVQISEMSTLSLSIAALGLLFRRRPQPEALRQLARLLLAFVILWSYLAFMQLLIVWQSDLPYEAAWYLPRWRQEWRVTADSSSSRISLRLFHAAFLRGPTFATSGWICRGVDHCWWNS